MSGDLLADQIRPLQSALYFPSNQNGYYKCRDFKLSAPILTVPTAGLDEIDNNTYNDLLQIGFKPCYAMNDIFHREDERLKTFDSWPLDWLDKKELAMSGMFYTGEDDKTKCYFCEVEIGRWEPEDQPVSEHLRWFPNCPLLRRRTTNNVPINSEALERLLPAPSYDICGLNEHIEIRRNAFPEGTIPATDILPATTFAGSSSSSSSNIRLNSAAFDPKYPEYAIETARLRTFANWPSHMKQKPDQLAEAGFFYTGVGDGVKCFTCSVGLNDWDESDDIWEQHARWMNKCPYVKLIKGDAYVETIANRYNKSSTNANEEGESQNVGATVPSAVVAQTLPTVSNIACTKQTLAATSGNLCQQNAKPCSAIPEEKLCKICYASEYNTAFLPCGHVVACAKCASSVTKCPLCRKPFSHVMRLYFP